MKLSESIEGMRIVQAFRQEKRLTDEFERINGEHLDYANRSVDVNSSFEASYDPVTGPGLCGHSDLFRP